MSGELFITNKGRSSNGNHHHFNVSDERNFTIQSDTLRVYHSDSWHVEAFRNSGGWILVVRYTARDGFDKNADPEAVVRQAWEQIFA